MNQDITFCANFRQYRKESFCARTKWLAITVASFADFYDPDTDCEYFIEHNEVIHERDTK